MLTKKLDSFPLTNAISGIDPEHIDVFTERLTPVLSRVVTEETGYDLKSVFDAAKAAHMQIWVVNDFQSVIVTAVQNFPLHKTLLTRFMAGEGMQDWLDEWKVVQEAFARDNGCKYVEFHGRKGWRKIGEEYPDYAQHAVSFRKVL